MKTLFAAKSYIPLNIIRDWLLCTILLLLPVSAAWSNVWSKDISFDYIQADFISKAINLGESPSEVDGTGIGFSLSLSILPAIAMRLAVESTTLEAFQNISVDTIKTTELGVTAHTSLNITSAVYATVSVLKAEITASNGGEEISDKSMGFSIDLGVRHKLSDLMELELSASHVNAFSVTVNSFALDGRFYIRKNLSIGLGFKSSGDVDSLLLNARMDI